MGTTPVLALAVIAAFAYGLGEGALIPTLQDVAASVPPDHLRGGALAAWVGAARLGQSSGPLLATPLIAVGGTGVTIVIGGVAAAGILATKIWGPLDDRRLAAARAD
jgi:sugar phosphate permease